MDILDRISFVIGEEGEAVGPATTTGDVAKVPVGTEKTYNKAKKKRKKKIFGEEEEEELEVKQRKNTETLGEL